MVHGDTIANGYGIDFERHSASTADTIFYRLGNCLQMDVTGDNLAEAIDYSNKRFIPVI
jgi:hypothetical protein